MFAALRTFLVSDAPTQRQAAGALRTLFVVAFVGQAGLALVAWGVLMIFFSPEPATLPLTAQVLLGVAASMLPLALALAAITARSGTQAGALTATLLQGILLAVPVWFALFCWLIGSPTRYTLALLGLAALYYGLGLLFASRYAAQATVTDAQPAKF